MGRVIINKVEFRIVAGGNEIYLKERMNEIYNLDRKKRIINILEFDRHNYLSINYLKSNEKYLLFVFFSFSVLYLFNNLRRVHGLKYNSL